MLLLEHQGKALLRRYGIATPIGSVVEDETGLLEAVGEGEVVILKAQVAAGGRGKAGGIMVATGGEEARRALARLQGMTIAGHEVRQVLIEERIAFACERYLGIQIDNGRLWLLLAARGGIDVEAVTRQDAQNLRTIELNVLDGPQSAELLEAFAGLGLERALWPAYSEVIDRLFRLSRESDAVTAEINPLVETRDGRLVALDARIFVDETALARHPEFDVLQSADQVGGDAAADAPRFKDNPAGGSIGLIGFGSGLNITLMDWIALAGGQVGTLVDIDAMVTGGRGEAGFAAAFARMDDDPAIRAVLVCIISCGNRMDDVVQQLVAACRRRRAVAKPITLYLRGNRMSEARPLLDEAGLRNSRSLSDAVNALVMAARSEKAP
ncbi:MAG: ATP-grasp domain-containing protein [Hyphomicrobiaceae bacterium]